MNLIDQHSIVRRAKLRGLDAELPVLVDLAIMHVTYRPERRTKVNDRPALEIEITEEMIEAGVAALNDHLCDGYILNLEKPDAVRAIWIALRQLAAGPSSPL